MVENEMTKFNDKRPTVPNVDAISRAVDIITTASGVSQLEAKTCVYYAVCTYGLEQLELCPLLVAYGPTGTGKSALMKVLGKLVNKPVLLGTNLTQAGLRDKLDKAKESTAFIEEGDTSHEDYIANRYSRATSASSVKRTGNAGWTDTSVNYFGATILHKRKPFNDPATDSRSILIKTRPRPGKEYHIPEVSESVRDELRQLWQLASVVYKAMDTSGRAADVWKPLMAVAVACADEEWLKYANNELSKAADKLRLGQDFEPEAMVVNAVMAVSHKQSNGDLVSLSEIGQELKRETNWQPSSWALANTLRELGFEIRKSHGHQKVLINKIQIDVLSKELGMEDEVTVEDIVPPSIRCLV